MKRLFIVLVITAAVGIAGSAFISQPVKEAKKTDTVWFEYTPINSNGPLDPDNYTETGSTAACSDFTGSLCSVKADADDNTGVPGQRKPLLSSLQDIESSVGFESYTEGIVQMRN